MMPDTEQNNLLDRNQLIEQAFSAIMKLTEDERLRVLSKYAERYGWNT